MSKTKSKRATKKTSGKKTLPPFDKYRLYLDSVQCPDQDCEFFETTYKKIRNKRPKILREDFCGTFAVCCEWVKAKSDREAHGVDLDSEPILYGYKANYPELTPEQKSRVQIHQKNVLDLDVPKADIIAAANFSYFIFKDRKLLKSYFTNCLKSLKTDGLLILDCFGGTECTEPNEEVTNHGAFKYFWDQDSFDPVTNHAVFYIHYQRKGEEKRKRVFKYDWRMWSIPELREILEESGFKKTHVYWEGTAKDGSGDGIFTSVKVGEPCESWIAYIVGEK